MTPKVSVVVTSFNRKRMLAECLASLVAARADEVIVCDDGSTFNVAAVCAGALHGRCRWALVAAPPLTVDERMATIRQGRLINDALALTSGEIQYLICDDDLVAPGWLDALRAHWAEYPQRELVRGDWLVFTDGDTPGEADPPCPLDERQMTAGNFAWHASLTRERGVEWPTDQLNCLDNGFLVNCHRHGISQYGVPNVGMAGHRRDHAKTNIRHSDGSRHLESFRAVLASGSMED